MITVDFIKQWEGFKSRPYNCPAGVPTIGYGTTHYIDGSSVKLSDSTITEYDATILMEHDISAIKVAIDCILDTELNENQESAIIDFVYNLGLTNFINSTLCKKIKQYSDDPAIETEFNKWIYAKGKVLNGLIKRRKAESALYFTAI